MRGFWLLPPLLLAACAGPGPERGCAGAFTLSNQSGREIEQLYAGSEQVELGPVNLCALPRVVINPAGVSANPP